MQSFESEALGVALVQHASKELDASPCFVNMTGLHMLAEQDDIIADARLDARQRGMRDRIGEAHRLGKRRDVRAQRFGLGLPDRNATGRLSVRPVVAAGAAVTPARAATVPAAP